MTEQQREGVLSRWSRRKTEAQQQPSATPVLETEQNQRAPLNQPVVENGELDSPPVSNDSPLTDADMPDIESLDENADFSGFMSSKVSDELRNLALRKMFHAPKFNIRDGLDEYDDDYTSFEKLGDIVTCDMKHALEMEEKKKREQEEAEAADKAELRQDSNVEVEAVDEHQSNEEPEVTISKQADAAPDSVPDTPELFEHKNAD